MGKRGGGGGTGLIRLSLLLALLTLVGYNTYELSRLRAEVTELRRERAVLSHSAKTDKTGVEDSSFVAQARRHAERAQDLLRRNEYDAARREIERATEAARRAGADARAGGEGALVGLRDSARRLAERAGAMLSTTSRDGASERQSKK
jgi:biopolymer transport protein ExbB/TolQ